jgi:hypothetical protein
MQARRSSTNSNHPRRGLAPLEFVLVLPVLLSVMALMVIFGLAGRLKVRTVVNSREAVWRELGRRNSNALNAPPRGWPGGSDGSVFSGDGPPMRLASFATGRFDMHQVMRGPVIIDSAGVAMPIPVNSNRFNILNGVQRGSARAKADYPLLKGMGTGRVDLSRQHEVVDNLWRYWETGVGGNVARRINSGGRANPFYRTPRPQELTPQEWREFDDAHRELLEYRLDNQRALLVMDDDQELTEPSPWGLGRPEDYYVSVSSQVRKPYKLAIRKLKQYHDRGLTSFQGVDPSNMVLSTNERGNIRQHLETVLMDGLVESIQGIYGERDPQGSFREQTGLPGRMADDFLNMYNRQTSYINGLRNELQSMPPPDAARIQFIMGEINRFESADPPIAKREELLRQFRQYLLGIELTPP